MPFYLYLIQSLKDQSYYIGQTNNLKERLRRHNNREVKSTRDRAPFKLIGFKTYKTREQARYREYQIKRHSGQRKRFIQSITKKGRL